MTQNKRAVKTDDFTRLNVYSDPQVSPANNSFTFVSTIINEKKKYSSTIHLYDLEKQQAKQWTYTDHKDSHPRFSPCGKYIAFQSSRSGRPQIWLMPTDGGEAKQITSFTYGAMNPHWSKDGRHIIFTAPLERHTDVATQKELSKAEYKKERSEEHTSELQSRGHLVCRLLLAK